MDKIATSKRGIFIRILLTAGTGSGHCELVRTMWITKENTLGREKASIYEGQGSSQGSDLNSYPL